MAAAETEESTMRPTSFEHLDRDGAIVEAASALPAHTRRSFLRHAASIGGGVVLLEGLAAAFPAVGQTAANPDLAILRFDLTLEYLQAALYTEAERLGALDRSTLAWSRVVGAHERAHVQAIRAFLGRAAQRSPSFDFRGVTENQDAFTRTAVAFEDLTAALLKDQAPRIRSRNLLTAIFTLHSVEARHAAWIRHLVGIPPVTAAFDVPKSERFIRNLVRRTRFVESRPAEKVRVQRRPQFTG
jgi:hypothetical protein